MKTFREFMVLVEKDSATQRPDSEAAWREKSDKESLGDRASATKRQYNSYVAQGMSPENAKKMSERWANRTFGTTTRASGQDIRSGSQTRTQTPPRQPSSSTQTPPRGAQTSSTSTPPPRSSQRPASSTPPRTAPGQLSTAVRPSTAQTPVSQKPGFRSRLGSIANPALNVAGAAMDYKARREAGQSRVRAAGGAASQLAGYAAAAKFGAMVPGPPIVKGAAAIGAGIVGAEKAGQAYDYAANKTRPARQAVAKATGFDKFQQKNTLIKPGSGISGIARAQQTVNTRGARQVAAKAGTYGTRQGSALTGAGGPTTVNRKAGTLTSGGKTAKLSSTQLVRDPRSGKQVVGDLAYKGGKAVYLARPSIQSRDTSLAARVGRALNIGKYSKAAETQAAKQEYRTALRGTQQYQRQLGITPKAATAQRLPGRGVGPKKVGPKLVGPKKVGPKIVGTKK